MGKALPLGSSRQEAWHIGALHRPRAGACPHRAQRLQGGLLRQSTQQLGQALDVLKQGVALPQTQLAGADVQDPAPVDASRPVKHGAGGGVVAGVQPQDPHGHASGAVSVLAAAFSGLAGVS